MQNQILHIFYKYKPPFIPDTSNREFPADFLNLNSKKNTMEKYNGYEDQEWMDYWDMNDADPYDPFEGSEG